MKYLPVLLTVLLVAGCSTGKWGAYAETQRAYYAYATVTVKQCGDNGACVLGVALETSRSAPAAPRSGWDYVLQTVGIVAPYAAGYGMGETWAGVLEGTVGVIAGMDRSYTDASNTVTTTTTVGGDQIGRDRTEDNSDRSDNSTTAGRDIVGRDLYSASCVGERCRYGSDGPTDQSDNSQTDQSDNRQNETVNNLPL